jgi:RNA polymerase sigma-70 factor (ECF subfamily)
MSLPIGADAEWVATAYAAHGPELYRFAFRALGDGGLAEEAVQSTYLRAWRAAERFDETLGSLRTWLFAIIRNVVIDMARARQARPMLADATAGEAAIDLPSHPDVEIDRVLLAWQVEEALRRLSPDHRTVILEIYYRGRSYDEVANRLAIPPGTVKSRVYYGLRALRLALEELGWQDDA